MGKNVSVERKILLLTSLGSVLEYYDFVVYGMLAIYLKGAFFPAENETAAALQFFSVFAIGYFIRPFGGIIAGVIGDKLGRKPAFLYLTTIMAISTLMIGILPIYSQVGFLATFLLLLCRIGQGLSFGGELPGATTIVSEFTPFKHKGTRISFVIAGVSVGALAASFVLFSLTTLLDKVEMAEWGWRIPFIIGGFFGIALFWARKNLVETPEFQSLAVIAKENSPLKELTYHHRPSVIAGILFTAFSSAMVISNIYFPYYLKHYFSFPEKNIYFAATLSLTFSALIFPLTGRLSDRFSKHKLVKWTTLSYLVFSYLLFNLLSYQSIYSLILFMFLHQFYIALFSSCYFPIIINLFPTKVRYTGTALCYNIGYATMGTLPTIFTFLLSKFQTPYIVPYTLMGMAVISYMAVSWIEGIEKRRIVPDTGRTALDGN